MKLDLGEPVNLAGAILGASLLDSLKEDRR